MRNLPERGVSSETDASLRRGRQVSSGQCGSRNEKKIKSLSPGDLHDPEAKEGV